MARKRTRFPRSRTAKRVPNKLGGGNSLPSSPPPARGSRNVNQSIAAYNKYNLSPKHFRFFCEYIRDYDKIRAYKAAGYKSKAPEQAASVLLRRPDIRYAIKQWEEEQLESTKIGVERILEELSKIAFCDPRKFFLPDGRLKSIPSLGDMEAGAIASIHFSCDRNGNTYVSSIRLCSKESALLNYGKHLGMFKPDVAKMSDTDAAAAKLREAQQAMLATLPLDQAKIIKGHFGGA